MDKKNMDKKIDKTFLIFVVIGIILFVTIRGLPAEGAQLSFSPASQEFGEGQTFEVEILLDTQKEDINAIEGDINFSDQLLSLKEIRDGGSIINLWIKKPQNNNGAITFAGIVPGGYWGDKGRIFSLVFQTKKEGEGDLTFQNFKILLNDGEGTAASLVFKPSRYKILESFPIIRQEINADNDPPEPFQPEINRSTEIFNNEYFLVFNTQDKESGIAYYEIKEGRRQFEKAESPYLLKNQWIYEEIIVRAVDKAGNIREAIVSPLRVRPIFFTFKFWLMAVLILLVIGVVIYVIRRLLKKRNLENRI